MATGPGGSQAGLCAEGPEGVGTLPATAEPPRGQPGGETEHVCVPFVPGRLPAALRGAQAGDDRVA